MRFKTHGTISPVEDSKNRTNMSKNKILPKVVEKSEQELDEILLAIRSSNLADETKSFAIKCIELALWIPMALQAKNISLRRLQTLLFGKGYGKKKKNKPKGDSSGSDNTNESEAGVDSRLSTDDVSESETDDTSDHKTGDDNSLESMTTPTVDNKKQAGHGRMPHTVYHDFTPITLSTELAAGDPCPMECNGRLYSSDPGILVRVRGQSIAAVFKYDVKKLRCASCGYLVSADIPPEVGDEKYDAKFKSWLVLQKYFVAVPFYRQEYFQGLIGFRLPDATQWDLVEQVAGCCYPVFNYLKILAAQGNRIFNDDTRVRILEIIKNIKADPDCERTGMYTTGIISEIEGHQIALFLNGTQHAGENLEDVLAKRSTDLPPIIQMCDGLSLNIPKSIETIVCNCMSHGFRKFDELIDYFPNECITIIKQLSIVYDHDEKTKGMTDADRLTYHQEHSAPVMEALDITMAKLLDDHLVEPNSELGKAIIYMQKRWSKLTRFLTVAGAPLDNNIVERALKIAIRNRKAAMFYKTCYSASIGGMLISLIYTCSLAKENAMDYLTALQKNKGLVAKSPQSWLPWNFVQTLASLGSNHSSTVDVASPQEL